MLHLIHPAVVHFAVAFLVAGGAAEIVGIATGRERLERRGGLGVVLGTLALVFTAVSGFLARNTAPNAVAAAADLDRHEALGMATLGWFAILLFWKGWERGRVRGRRRAVYAAAVAVGVAGVVLGAAIGGHAVYDHGVGVDLERVCPPGPSGVAPE